MANIFTDGEELLNKKDFDKKLNVDQSTFYQMTAFNKWSDVIPDRNKANVLTSLRDDTDIGNKYTAGGNGAGLLFGGLDTHAMITARWNQPVVIISAGNYDGGNPTWSEQLAFKSDIDALKARISALEKQIGGVLSSALNHLFRARKVAA